MGIIKKDFKFKKIKNFLSEQEINFLSSYCEIKHRNNQSNFDFFQSNNGDTKFYGDTAMADRQTDWCNKSGAQQVARDVALFWEERGGIVATHVVPVYGSRGRYDVRSDMVNGLPKQFNPKT